MLLAGCAHGRGGAPRSTELVSVEPISSDAPRSEERTPLDGPRTRASGPRAADRPDARAFSLPIVVEDDTGLERYPPILSFFVPLARALDRRGLDDLVATTLDGRALPTQTEVLSRWGDAPSSDAPVRFGYAFVRGRVPPEARAYLQLAAEPGRPRDPDPRAPEITIDESDARWVIDTGAARFTVPRDHFRGFSKIELRSGDGLRNILADEGSDFLVEHEGARSSPRHGRTFALDLERRGPLVTTLLARGTYAAPNGDAIFDYAVRLTFYAGTAAVLVDHTYYNGHITDDSARGAQNRVSTDRVYLHLPLAIGDHPRVTARTSEEVHELSPDRVVSVVQDKRSPDRPDVVSAILHGKDALELGTFADRPMLAASGDGLYAMATIGWLGPRDPQALRFDPKTRALEVDFQSEPLFVGGARGVWSRAMLDFGRAGSVDLPTRGAQLYAHATRPLVGAPNIAAVNASGALGRFPSGEASRFDRRLDRVHDRTVDFLRRYRVTGTQLWPDLPRAACRGSACLTLAEGYFEGGDDNYWDWSLAELHAFLRTADPAFLHDVALPEAITMAETIVFRPSPLGDARSTFAGLSPCYGAGRDDAGAWHEGLNHRLGTCPGDYSYDEVHHLAYVLTADRRFLDLFDEGAKSALAMYGDPARGPPAKWHELSASRTTSQVLEILLDAAEFSRDVAANRRYRDAAVGYVRHMIAHALAGGHTCDLLGLRSHDPKALGTCTSDQAWMLPPFVESIARVAALYEVREAKDWLGTFAETSPRRHAPLDGDGRPKLDLDHAHTVYRCPAGPSGIDDARCAPVTELENEGRFYPNGLVAYLGALALTLELHPDDPARLCRWLPDAYDRALEDLDPSTNDGVWGKELGQAYAFAQRALGALEACKKD